MQVHIKNPIYRMVTVKHMSKTTKGSIQALVMGTAVSPEMVHELNRLSKLGGKIEASPKVFNLLANAGVKSQDFTKTEDGVVMHQGYPKSGFPLGMMARITGFDVTKGKDQKIPFNIVVVEIAETAGVVSEGEPFSEVQNALHYNSIAVATTAANAGKIVYTSAKKLKQLNDYLERKTGVTDEVSVISEEMYDALAKRNFHTTMKAIARWTQNLVQSSRSTYEQSLETLKAEQFFTEEVAAN